MTEFVMRIRQGIGLDIEYNEDICYRVHYQDDSEGVVCYRGILISIPFCTIYIGEFLPIETFEGDDLGEPQ